VDGVTQSEDCLSLNVWAPYGAKNAPVAVYSKCSHFGSTFFPNHHLQPPHPLLTHMHLLFKYITLTATVHGGGFMSGSTAEPVYEADWFVSRGNLVVVTMNYRLGALGFLSGAGDLKGNYGIMDQRMALQWVKDNINAFGGNPNHVTLFGQSAGAMSTLTHYVSDGSAGLFNRVIIQSPVGLQYQVHDQARKKAEIFAHSLFCSVDDIKCLRSRPVGWITALDLATEYVFDLTNTKSINFLPWLPAVDGDVLLDQPMDLIANKKVPNKDVEVIIGSVLNETAIWVPYFIVDTSITEDIVFDLQWGKLGSEVHNFYKSIGYTESVGRRVEGALTDYLFTCYVRRLANNLIAAGVRVSVYHFLYIPSFLAGLYDDIGGLGKNCESAVCHASELSFVWHTAEVQIDTKTKTKGGFVGNEASLSMTMVESWLKFFHHSFELNDPVWPKWDSNKRSTAFDIFEDGSMKQERINFHGDACDWWDTQNYWP
jgi:carboxylesterase type B